MSFFSDQYIDDCDRRTVDDDILDQRDGVSSKPTLPTTSHISELRTINPEIANHIASYYANLSDDVSLLDIIPPHAMAHQIAANYPGLGAAFYRLVEATAREALDRRIGWLPASPADPPPVSPALAGLIGSKDSSWF